MRKCLLGLISALMIQSAYADSSSSILYDWNEFAPNNQLQERVITTNNSCPDKTMDIIHVADNNFPVTVCQKTFTCNPKFNPTRIVIFGDTGCRIKKGGKAQDCDNLKKWPFKETVRSALKWKPDLVIDVGDYLYRESSCPPGNKGCANSPYGDNWTTWQADFFKPAKPLLNSSIPWIFVRGNHENCDRAGHGWNVLLDPYHFKHCMDYSPLYYVDIGDTRLFIMDSSSANDVVAPPDQLNWFENYLEVIARSHAKHNWVITHKPFWFVYSDNPLHQAVQKHVLNTLQTAWEEELPDNVDLLIAGHVHRFQVINLTPSNKYPPQLIAGVSGATLAPKLENSDLKGFNIINRSIDQGISVNSFGFVSMEKQSDGTWKVDLHNPYGTVLVRCVLENQQLSCYKKNN